MFLVGGNWWLRSSYPTNNNNARNVNNNGNINNNNVNNSLGVRPALLAFLPSLVLLR